MAAEERNTLIGAEETAHIPIVFFLRDMISRINDALFFLRGKIATFELLFPFDWSCTTDFL